MMNKSTKLKDWKKIDRQWNSVRRNTVKMKKKMFHNNLCNKIRFRPSKKIVCDITHCVITQYRLCDRKFSLCDTNHHPRRSEGIWILLNQSIASLKNDKKFFYKIKKIKRRYEIVRNGDDWWKMGNALKR